MIWPSGSWPPPDRSRHPTDPATSYARLVRQFLTLRYWATLFVLFILILTLYLAVGRSGPSEVIDSTEVRRIDLIASTSTVRSDSVWSVANGRAVGNATAVLSDGRVLAIADGTLGVSTCLFPDVLNACVMLADTLGDGVVWFALVPAPEGDDRELALPAIEELLDGVTYARLENGWVVPLLDKVKRRCEVETPGLKSFVQRFAGSHRTIVDLDRAQVSAVECDA